MGSEDSLTEGVGRNGMESWEEDGHKATRHTLSACPLLRTTRGNPSRHIDDNEGSMRTRLRALGIISVVRCHDEGRIWGAGDDAYLLSFMV